MTEEFMKDFNERLNAIKIERKLLHESFKKSTKNDKNLINERIKYYTQFLKYKNFPIKFFSDDPKVEFTANEAITILNSLLKEV